MKFARSVSIVAMLIASLFAVAQPVRADNTLYKKLGEEAGISTVVDSFISVVANDVRINHFFAHANVPRLKGLLVQLLGMASGGPQKYSGRDMKVSHAGMGIRDADFNALAEDLYVAMEKANVPFATQQKVMALLAPMESQIATR